MFSINGYTWDILSVSSNHPILRKSDGTYTIGACDNNEQVIYISEDLTPTKMKKVLCHEITHALMFSYGIDLSLYTEEILADFMATYGREIMTLVYSITKKRETHN